MRRRTALGLLGGAMIAPPLLQQTLAQTPTAASPSEFLGLTIGTELNWENWRGKLLPLYRDAQIKWLRVWYNWASLEPQPGVYGDALTLSSLQLAKQWGFRILFVVWGTPPHAGSGSLESVPRADALANYCNWLKQNFKGLVDAWEIGNEPNLYKYFTGTPAEYVSSLATAYQVLQGSGTVVAAAPSAAATPDYWQALLDNGLEQYCDRVNLHPYRTQPRQVAQLVDSFLTRVNKPLWITELGLSTEDGGEQGKAQFARQVLPLLATRAEKVFWYRSIQGGGLNPLNYGLIRANLGQQTVTPLPSYYAIQSRRTI